MNFGLFHFRTNLIVPCWSPHFPASRIMLSKTAEVNDASSSHFFFHFLKTFIFSLSSSIFHPHRISSHLTSSNIISSHHDIICSSLNSCHLISSHLFRRFRSPAKTAQFDQPPEREKRKERKKRKKQSEGRRLSAGRTTFVLYHEFRTFALSDKSCGGIRAKIEML